MDEHTFEKVDLQEDGVLWMLNRTVFHPRGYALAVDETGTFTLHGSGLEPWMYPPEVDEAKFTAFRKLMRRPGLRRGHALLERIQAGLAEGEQ